MIDKISDSKYPSYGSFDICDSYLRTVSSAEYAGRDYAVTCGPYKIYIQNDRRHHHFADPRERTRMLSRFANASSRRQISRICFVRYRDAPPSHAAIREILDGIIQTRYDVTVAYRYGDRLCMIPVL